MLSQLANTQNKFDAFRTSIGTWRLIPSKQPKNQKNVYKLTRLPPQPVPTVGWHWTFLDDFLGMVQLDEIRGNSSPLGAKYRLWELFLDVYV